MMNQICKCKNASSYAELRQTVPSSELKTRERSEVKFGCVNMLLSNSQPQDFGVFASPAPLSTQLCPLFAKNLFLNPKKLPIQRSPRSGPPTSSSPKRRRIAPHPATTLQVQYTSQSWGLSVLVEHSNAEVSLVLSMADRHIHNHTQAHMHIYIHRHTHTHMHAHIYNSNRASPVMMLSYPPVTFQVPIRAFDGQDHCGLVQSHSSSSFAHILNFVMRLPLKLTLKIHTCTHMHTHACMPLKTHTCTHVHIHAQRHKHPHSHNHAMHMHTTRTHITHAHATQTHPHTKHAYTTHMQVKTTHATHMHSKHTYATQAHTTYMHVHTHTTKEHATNMHAKHTPGHAYAR